MSLDVDEGDVVALVFETDDGEVFVEGEVVDGELGTNVEFDDVKLWDGEYSRLRLWVTDDGPVMEFVDGDGDTKMMDEMDFEEELVGYAT